MALQKVVNIDPALGVPGSQATFYNEVTTINNYISDGTATAGNFAFEGTATVNAAGSSMGIATATATEGTKPLGLVVRLIDGVLADGVDSSLIYERGCNVTIAIRGDFYVVATGTATVGDSVNVEATTGEVTYGTIAEEGTEVATGFTVTKGGSTGDVIVISNHG